MMRHFRFRRLDYCCEVSGRVAELADAQASGACIRKDVGVQVPPRPPAEVLSDRSASEDSYRTDAPSSAQSTDNSRPPDDATSLSSSHHGSSSTVFGWCCDP